MQRKNQNWIKDQQRFSLDSEHGTSEKAEFIFNARCETNSMRKFISLFFTTRLLYFTRSCVWQSHFAMLVTRSLPAVIKADTQTSGRCENKNTDFILELNNLKKIDEILWLS
jgi:hypothetical protein